MIFDIDRRDPERTALLSDGGQSVSYGILSDHIRRIGEAVPAGSLAFCLCRNVPGSVIGYLGLVQNSCAPLLLDAKLDPARFAGLFSCYRPSYLWIPEDLSGSFQPYIRKEILEMDGYCLCATGQERADLNQSLALLLATSGSTGDPRLVRLSRENIMSNAAAICRYLMITQEERPITTLPMHYTYGLSIINSHLLAGACVLMTSSSYVQQPFWDFFSREKATSFGGVPYTYQILDRLHIFRGKLPSLRSCTQAGGKLPEALQRKIAVWAEGSGVKFFVMYGQTEATARMAYLPPQDCLNKPGSIGIPIPGGRFEIIDKEGNVLQQPGQTGELVYIGPNVCLGYAACREDLARGDDNRGRLLTGDIARKDEDGYYYIVGRKKRFLKIFGIRISLDECEKLLKEEYPGTEIFCGGEDNDLRIYCRDRKAAAEGAVFLADQLHQSRSAFSSSYIPQIPRNEYGKILYKEFDRYVAS